MALGGGGWHPLDASSLHEVFSVIIRKRMWIGHQFVEKQRMKLSEGHPKFELWDWIHYSYRSCNLNTTRLI